MKRYDSLTQWPFDMREAPDGDWVRFDDAEDAIRAAVAADRERILAALIADGLNPKCCADLVRGHIGPKV